VQRFERFVGLVVIGLAALGAILMAMAAALIVHDPAPTNQASWARLLGFWQLLYSTSAPPVGVIVGAAGLGLLVAAVVALIERRIGTRARGSEDRNQMPLAPKLVMADTRAVHAGPVTVTVLIPAHNEAGCIADTITSLRTSPTSLSESSSSLTTARTKPSQSPGRLESRSSRPTATPRRRQVRSTRLCQACLLTRATTTQ
jgi:biofilm PGA synthesis N-glycosyltransferase PgaC